MKNRIKALFLASILAACALTSAAAAEEAATESAVEVSTEAAAPAAMEPTEVTGEGIYAMYYPQMQMMASQSMQALSAMTPEEVQAKIDDEMTDAVAKSIFANWQTVQSEVGNFVEINEYSIEEDGPRVTVVSDVKYDGVKDNTVVTVSMTINMNDQSTAFAWNVQKPKSQLFAEAGLNTLLGMGTVFVVLVFLSFLIGQIHWIPDLIEGRKKKNAPAPAPAPAAAPVVEEVEEEYVDDTELIAVIAAAIAAAEQTSTDGFVVRSIRKVNKKNWQNA